MDGNFLEGEEREREIVDRSFDFLFSQGGRRKRKKVLATKCCRGKEESFS